MEPDTYTATAIILYLVVEGIKYWIGNQKNSECHLRPDDQKKLDDLHDWHSILDDEGRRLWYVPKNLAIQQQSILEMLREISANQDRTARVLSDLNRKSEK